MSLSSNVQSRYGASYLISLTNPHNPNSQTLNATTLDAAVADAIAKIAIDCGVTYDDTDARHVAVAVDVVIFILMMRTGQFNNGEIEERLNARLLGLAKVTGRDRIIPKTDSLLTPTGDPQSGSPVQPYFDSGRWNDIIPGAPGAGADNPYPLP